MRPAIHRSLPRAGPNTRKTDLLFVLLPNPIRPDSGFKSASSDLDDNAVKPHYYDLGNDELLLPGVQKESPSFCYSHLEDRTNLSNNERILTVLTILINKVVLLYLKLRLVGF